MPTYEVVGYAGDRVEIIKRPDRNPYYAYYRDSNGKPHYDSLRTRNLKEARRRAQDLLSALENDTHSRTQEVRKSKGVTFRMAVDHYMEMAPGTEEALYTTRCRLDYICGDLEHKTRYPKEGWGPLRVQSIKAKDIQNWIRNEKKANKWSDSTEHHYLNAIKQVLKEAKLQNWVVNSEATEIPKPRITDEEIPEVLDEEVVEPLFAALPEYVEYIMAILLDTGLRMGELFKLQWRDVVTDGDEPHIIVRKHEKDGRHSKSGKFRVVPLAASIAIFDHMRQGLKFSVMDSPYRTRNGYAKLDPEQRDQMISDISATTCDCFKGADGYCPSCKELIAKYDITVAHARKVWLNRDKDRPEIVWPSDDDQTACVIPKMDFRKALNRAAKELGVETFKPHQMRHTWATRLLNDPENGIDHYQLMKLGGWSTLAMVERYARVDVIRLAPKVRKALAKLPGGNVRVRKPLLRVVQNN